ncbi:hypothetical protein CDAR_489701 [Caerostris darwini]|uniref:Uncharacterized protein n=1 Tax=Caerostris darwini TaxID=1538125 RepID=A0AAV4VIX0_9ARAC|nr:hypothetical protein CDAR_489701 [Caerostris darwini]
MLDKFASTFYSLGGAEMVCNRLLKCKNPVKKLKSPLVSLTNQEIHHLVLPTLQESYVSSLLWAVHLIPALLLLMTSSHFLQQLNGLQCHSSQ